MYIILIIVNIIAFIMYGVDKRRAVHHQWRISERALILISVFGGVGGLLGMIVFHHKTRKWKFRILVPMFAVVEIAAAAFFMWTSVYYHADEYAAAALQSDETVTVREVSTGWMFDGPYDEDAYIFYPGAKVEETSYAPLLHRLAEEDMDVFLVKMPLRLAFFGMNRAGDIIGSSSYKRYYMGGHSLGGAMAASYASGHEQDIAGMILLASYPAKEIDIDTLAVYGSNDGVLNMDRMNKAKDMVSGRYHESVIEGGNHAQFGNYGIQRGDGTADITWTEQQSRTVEEIRKWIS